MLLRKKLLLVAFRLAIVLFLFQKNSTPGKFIDESEKLKDDSTDFSRIRCPVCRWQPNASSRWYCADAGYPHYFFNGCGTVWNTFDTRGRCPGCGHQWKWTDCLRCGNCSPHEAWYEEITD
jgi:rubrerythrin